ncbi:MAG: hypothetical protein QXT81_03190, partial [Candidatus Bathyarchaeia archaeon]
MNLVGGEDVLVPDTQVSSLLLLSILALVPVSSHLIATSVACVEVSMVRSGDRCGDTVPEILLALVVESKKQPAL